MELYSTNSEEKSVIFERWNRIIRERMLKYFTANSTYKYVDILSDLVNKYNNAKHSSLDVTNAGAEVKVTDHSVSVKPKFSIGDRVRITLKKVHFEKGCTPRLTEEVFTVSEVRQTCPITYKVNDYNNEPIEGSFYTQELQKTNQEICRIEKVIRTIGNKSLVKWKGYPDSFNSWVNNSELIDL